MSDDAMNVDSPAPLHRSSSASAPKPKGILKNPSSDVTSTLAHPSVNTASTNTSNTSSDVNGHQRDSTAHITAANTALNTPSGSQPIVPVQPSSTSAQETAGDVPVPPAGMTAAQRLHWDEASLEAAAAQGGGKMKITEPKTPYVRYNAELDRVENMEDIPNFELSGGGGGGGSETSRSPRSVISDLGEPVEGPSSGALGLGNPPASAATTDSSRRPSAPSRSSSRSVSIASGGHSRRSSRASEQPSVDFDTVPTTAGGGVAQGLGGSALDTEDGEDEDDISTWDPEKREQHERFAALRNRHYSNEAEAMKRAAELMKQEDEDAEDEDAAEVEETKADGIEEDQDDEDGEGDGNGASGTNGRQPNGITRVPPPVPAVPAQYRS